MPDTVPTVNVCLVADTFHPAFGGGALRFQRYFAGLRARGIEVQVVCGTPTAIKARLVNLEPSEDSARLGEFLPVETLDGVTIHRVRLHDVESHRKAYTFARALARHCQFRDKRPDVVQLFSLPPTATPALVKVRMWGIPIVYTGTMTVALPSNPVVLALKRLKFGVPLLLADSVVASTDFMRRQFRALGVKAPIEVITNGVNLQTFRPPVCPEEGSAVRRSLGIDPGDPVLLFVGSVTPRKGVELLLEAWLQHLKQHPRSHLIIVGPRPDKFYPVHADYHARLEALRRASGAPDRVHFLGVVSNIPELMRASDVFVFPSRREGMPNVVLEAMASGLPVVLTPFIGLADELGTPNVHYLLAEPDSHSLARQITRVIEDSDLRCRVAESARLWVEKHLDVERTLDLYAELYRKTASQMDASVINTIKRQSYAT